MAVSSDAGKPYVVFDVYNGRLQCKVTNPHTAVRIFQDLKSQSNPNGKQNSSRDRGRGRGRGAKSPRKPHGRQGNELKFALDWLYNQAYLDSDDDSGVKLGSIRHAPLTAQSMTQAAQQLARAIDTWQATFADRLMPLVLDIGGGGRNVANTIGSRGLQVLVDAILAGKDAVHVTLIRAHSASLGDDGLVQIVRLLRALPRPVWELHLSHNNITDVTLLLQQIASCQAYPYQASATRKACPLWLRLECNRLDAAAVLAQCAELSLRVCVPTTRESCGVKTCGLHTTPPAVHMPFLHHQVVGLAQLVAKRRQKQHGRSSVCNSKQLKIKTPSTSCNKKAKPEETTPAALSSSSQSDNHENESADVLIAELQRMALSQIDSANTADTSDHDTDGAAAAAVAPSIEFSPISASTPKRDRVTASVEPSLLPAVTYIVLDTSAIVGMVTQAFQAKHSKHGAVSRLFSFDNLLAMGVQDRLQLVVPHTVGVELDGLKGSRRLDVAGSKAVRGFLTDYGLRQQCVEAGLLLELSKEDGELDILQSGSLTSMHLAANDEMIVNVALHLRRAMLTMDSNERQDDSTDDGAGASDIDQEPPVSIAQASNASRSVLLLSDDANMIQAALKVGVPACNFSRFNQAIFERTEPFVSIDDGDGVLGVVWQEAGERARACADDADMHASMLEPTAQEAQQSELQTLSNAVEWLDVLAAILPEAELSASQQAFAEQAPLDQIQTQLQDMLARMHDTSMQQVAFADPRFYSRA
eukprot:TRINITY_DN11793_c0_g1_i4.p1 TRINITY_DN11793_c0_g1~~TRINITY_DN11793_c0_g1_i4.p1  ORF type:complete len:756 (+),score=151.48 TRINITY_DN11793_c0_g1_i4:240-2507(+)